MGYPCKELLKLMGIGPQEIEERKKLLGFTADDVEILKSTRPLIVGMVESVVHDFFAVVGRNFEFGTVVGNVETLERLEVSLRSYVLELFDGDYGLDYVASRVRIGEVHQRIGVVPKLFVFALLLLQSLLNKAIERRDGDPAVGARKEALHRALMIDASYILEAYIECLAHRDRAGQ